MSLADDWPSPYDAVFQTGRSLQGFKKSFLLQLYPGLYETSTIEQVDFFVSVEFSIMLHFSSPLYEIYKKGRKSHHFAKGDASKPPISWLQLLPPSFLHFYHLFPSNEGRTVVNYNPVQKDQVYIEQLQRAVCEETGSPFW